MKKLTIALLCILPFMANAEDLSSIYGKCPQVQVSQLYDVTFVEQTLKQYQQLEALAEAEYDRINMFLANEKKSAQSAAKNKQPQMNAQQKQVTMAMGNDMMAAMAAAGITPDKLAKMSDDEIMAVLMPVMAQQSGLSAEELQAMQGMSDKQAEAYIKGNANRSARVQNSNAAKYGAAMQGYEAASINDDDMAKLERMQEINEMISDDAMGNISNYEMENKIETFSNYEYDNYQPYEDRAHAIFLELAAKVDPLSKGQAIKTPAFAYAYYDRMNAVADEYNHIAIPQWDRFFNSRLNTVKGRLNKFLPLYLESWELYNSITDPNIKTMAISQLPHVVIYKYVSEYIGWQIKKLKGVPYHHYTVPPTMGGMG